MSTITQDLQQIKTVEDTLTLNKVARFAYTQQAYTKNNANGVTEYNPNQQQNIPVADASILKVNSSILNLGWRAQASALTRMLMNHFLGRISYNLNKVNDNVSAILSALIAKIGQAEGIATLDADGRVPSTQLPDLTVGGNSLSITKGFLGAVFGRLFGRVWHKGTGSNTDYTMQYLVYANGLWVCGSDSHGIWWSEDGKAWTQGTGSNTTLTMQYLVYANGLWVCGSNQGIWWSEDGKAWTQGTGGNTSLIMQYLVYANGLWVCGSNQGIWWSEDGKAWTQGTGSNTDYTMQYLVYANGLWVCGSAGQGIWWSEDGKAWTQGTGLTTTGIIASIIYANGLWVCGSAGQGIWWSEDGKAWTQGTGSTTGFTFQCLVYANGLWVCGQNYGIHWSEDGKAWNYVSLFASIQYLVYANGLWVCGSNQGIWWSKDGKAWHGGRQTPFNGALWPQNNESVLDDWTMQYLVYANGLWVCGSDSHGIWWSEDGKAWTQGTGSNTDYTMQYLVYANGLWVCGSVGHGIFHTDSIEDFIANGTIDLGHAVTLVN